MVKCGIVEVKKKYVEVVSSCGEKELRVCDEIVCE